MSIAKHIDPAARDEAAKAYADTFAEKTGLNRDSITPTEAGGEIKFWLSLLPAVDCILEAYLGFTPAGASFPYTEDGCPGHVGSAADPKVCGRCGIHIDSLRPDDGFNPQGSGPAPIEPREDRYDQGRRDVLNAILALNPKVAHKLHILSGGPGTPFRNHEGRLPFDVVFWVAEVASQLGIEPREG